MPRIILVSLLNSLAGTSLRDYNFFDGTYEMQVPIGNYARIKALKARYASKVFNETITVVENGKR